MLASFAGETFRPSKFLAGENPEGTRIPYESVFAYGGKQWPTKGAT